VNTTALRKGVLEKFAPRFAPHSVAIFVKGRSPLINLNVLGRLGLSADCREKWPDVMLYVPKKKQLYFIQVFGSCGLISLERRQELASLLSNSRIRCRYISVFRNLKTYSRHAQDIAWDTHVWLAEMPDHMIHHDGVRQLQPH